jgi:hypothetical protein
MNSPLGFSGPREIVARDITGSDIKIKQFGAIDNASGLLVMLENNLLRSATIYYYLQQLTKVYRSLQKSINFDKFDKIS